jgi:hypothetical protein
MKIAIAMTRAIKTVPVLFLAVIYPPLVCSLLSLLDVAHIPEEYTQARQRLARGGLKFAQELQG